MLQHRVPLSDGTVATGCAREIARACCGDAMRGFRATLDAAYTRKRRARGCAMAAGCMSREGGSIVYTCPAGHRICDNCFYYTHRSSLVAASVMHKHHVVDMRSAIVCCAPECNATWSTHEVKEATKRYFIGEEFQEFKEFIEKSHDAVDMYAVTVSAASDAPPPPRAL